MYAPRSCASSICGSASAMWCRSIRRVGPTHHDDAVLAQQRVQHALAEQHAVGHVLDARALRVGQVLEADRVPDLVAEHAADLLGDAGRDARGGDSPRLRARDDAPVGAPAGLVQVLGDLWGVRTNERERGYGKNGHGGADSRVDFPLPVWPTTIVTWYRSKQYRSFSRCLNTGRRLRCASSERSVRGADDTAAPPSSAARSRDEPDVSW